MPGIDMGKVCIFGAGGPVGASATQALKGDYILRLTDLRDIHDIQAENKPQSKFAPMPVVPEPPHEWWQVDVTDYDQVKEAASGMDALINVTVLRPELVAAFRVNMVGAYNVMKAAVSCGIRRVIHTGPRHTRLVHEGDYWYDFDVPDEAPLHPGTDLYALTKYLGGQVVRVFAEQHSLEVVCFLFCHFRPGNGKDANPGSGVSPFTTSWEDTGTAFRYGLRVPKLPHSYEVFDICARLPHGKFGSEKAERLLGWRPEYNFERLYKRSENLEKVPSK